MYFGTLLSPRFMLISHRKCSTFCAALKTTNLPGLFSFPLVFYKNANLHTSHLKTIFRWSFTSNFHLHVLVFNHTTSRENLIERWSFWIAFLFFVSDSSANYLTKEVDDVTGMYCNFFYGRFKHRGLAPPPSALANFFGFGLKGYFGSVSVFSLQFGFLVRVLIQVQHCCFRYQEKS